MAPPALRPLASTSTARLHLGQYMRWLLHINSGDLVRRKLNQGLQLVTLGLAALSPLVTVLGALQGDWGYLTIVSILFPWVSGAAFWLTRRGSTGGGLLIALFLTVVMGFGFSPETYADPPVIHALFLMPGLLASLFVNPWLGIPIALLLTLLLGLNMVAQAWPLSVVIDFVVICGVDLCGIMLPIAVAASLFRKTIAELSQLTEQLDAQVSERTAELRRLMALRESEIAAIVHDIQNRMILVRAEMDDLISGSIASGGEISEVRAAEVRLSTAFGAVGDLVGDLRMAVQLDNAALHIQRDLIDLELLVRRVVQQLATHAAQADVVVRLAAEAAPLILGDERKLERVLNNLIGNAIKYTRQSRLGQRLVEVQVRGARDGAEVLISDSGPGLTPEALRIVGTPFIRLASARGTEGMGLGVYISRGIVELHAGQLFFESPGPAGGTAVTLWLPTHPTPDV